MKRILPIVLLFGLALPGRSVEGQPFFERVSILNPPAGGRGTAISDFTNDGWLDFILSFDNRPDLLESDEGTRFVRMDRIIDDPNSGVLAKEAGGGAVTADFDNDGDLDLFIPLGSWAGPSLNRLLRNDVGTFTDVTLEAGLLDTLPTDNAIWLDFDRDGLIDLYTGNVDCFGLDRRGNVLYRNVGGRFVDWTIQADLDFDGQSGCGRGTNGGMAAGDYNGDGWPDLYLGVFNGGNRLFLNDGAGKFTDATTSAIADSGQAFGLAVGDLDNDGDLDLLQVAGGGNVGRQRSLLLLNAGDAGFIDVTTSAGLERLTSAAALSAGFADIDNDGDLDLVTISPAGLYLNDGNGVFSDVTEGSGYSGGSLTSSFVDYDEDGFQDVLIGIGNAFGSLLFHNTGNENHWLRIELVGTRSNRSAIGTRVHARTGNLRQTRELLGGRGYEQDELVVHFGLGASDRVDELEIRWPSGQIDSLFDIAADRKIRVIEGQAEATPVVKPAWVLVPGHVAVGQGRFTVVVRPALFEPDARIDQVVADLQDLGGDELALTDQGDGTFRADLPYATDERRPHHLRIDIRQMTSAGSVWMGLHRDIDVVPTEVLPIFTDGPSPGFTIGGNATVSEVSEEIAFTGSSALQAQGDGRWDLRFLATDLETFGYSSLRFALRLVDVQPGGNPGLFVQLAGALNSVNLLSTGRVDLTSTAWQVVEVPMSEFGTIRLAVSSIRFTVSFDAEIVLDEIALIPPDVQPPSTAIQESRVLAAPGEFALAQNYPNPFNPETTIRFNLAEASHVDLALYDLAGQRVSTMAEGFRPAGGYSLRWDGRDDAGHALASGIYFYRLTAGDQAVSRKLMLLR